MAELTDTERLALAREVAADRYVPLDESAGNFYDLVTDAFKAGWDAAMEYVNVQTKEQQ